MTIVTTVLHSYITIVIIVILPKFYSKGSSDSFNCSIELEALGKAIIY